MKNLLSVFRVSGRTNFTRLTKCDIKYRGYFECWRTDNGRRALACVRENWGHFSWILLIRKIILKFCLFFSRVEFAQLCAFNPDPAGSSPREKPSIFAGRDYSSVSSPGAEPRSRESEIDMREGKPLSFHSPTEISSAGNSWHASTGRFSIDSH